MKNFQILRYLKKLLPLIVVFCLLATYAVYFKLSRSNTYIASEVIHYNDEQAELGLAPTGDKLDVNEIKSSVVMSKVVDNMGLTGIYSVDSLISRIDITPIEDKDKVAQKEAKLEEGEEYIYEPSTFIVSFASTSGEGPDFARTILDQTLDVYFERFSQNYVNVAPANNTIENLDKNDYDFIEMMELIDTSVNETLNTLYQRMEQNNYYRSTETGVSFAELVDDFNYLRQVKVSSLFSKIYKYQITKNKSVLVSDYTTRIDNNNISNAKDESIVEDVLAVIDAYVKKMRDSGNTNITYEYILDEIHERNIQDYVGDQTVTYDELIYSWRDHNESKEHAVIDSAYCNYILDTFTACTGGCGGVCQNSALTCSALCNAQYAAVKEEVEREIDTLLTELNALYDTTRKTNEEYNKYLGASYISVLSSASVRESINVPLYTAIAFCFLMVLCCGGAIVLGRTGDIVNYIFYTDHLTEWNNRAYLDKYLKSKDKKLLDNGVVYCMVDITNLAHINGDHSREVGDEIIKMFTRYIKETFGKSKCEYIYNGNGSFVVLTEESDYITVEDIMRLFRLRLDEREEYRDVVIEYKIGISETFKENKTARKLLSEAIQNKKNYTSDLKEKQSL
ncbi:MAG: diguanylate cyclase [Ruminococcaceae bacterium]|nr:diguanylate cyclase [Oscillospiraceae bacterium]